MKNYTHPLSGPSDHLMRALEAARAARRDYKSGRRIELPQCSRTAGRHVQPPARLELEPNPKELDCFSDEEFDTADMEWSVIDDADPVDVEEDNRVRAAKRKKAAKMTEARKKEAKQVEDEEEEWQVIHMAPWDKWGAAEDSDAQLPGGQGCTCSDCKKITKGQANLKMKDGDTILDDFVVVCAEGARKAQEEAWRNEATVFGR